LPTRYLKPGIRDSEAIDAVSAQAECLFYRLLVTVDDFGRFDARPSMVKAACFPIKDSVSAADCERLLSSLSAHGLIVVYVCDGKPYLQMCKWDNQARAKVSKYPAPSDGCAQVHTSVRKPCTLLPETETETETENREPEPLLAPSAIALEAEPSVISIPLVGGRHHGITAERVAYFAQNFPAVDVMSELRKMAVWCDANPARRKTARGVAAFIANWLSKAQDRGGTSPMPLQSLPMGIAKGAAIEAHNNAVAQRILERMEREQRGTHDTE
jgi:hypothetical protein